MQYRNKYGMVTAISKVNFVFSSDKSESSTISHAPSDPTSFVKKVLDRRFLFKAFDLTVSPTSVEFEKAADDVKKMFENYIETGRMSHFKSGTGRLIMLCIGVFLIFMGGQQALFYYSMKAPFVFMFVFIAVIFMGVCICYKPVKEYFEEYKDKK